MLSGEYFDEIVTFLRHIDLPLEVGPFGAEGFLPGITIIDGVLRVDPAHLYVSGDLLHEAGHMAIVPARLRGKLGTNLEESLRDLITGDDDPLATLALRHTETMAIAWSYAALQALRLPPTVIFFAGGYRMEPEQQQQFVSLLDSGNYFGIAHLARAGLTGPCGVMALLQQNGLAPYPQMTKWLQD